MSPHTTSSLVAGAIFGPLGDAAAEAKRTKRIDPRKIRFTQATASPRLSKGSETIDDLIRVIQKNPSLVNEHSDLLINVVEYEGQLWTLNNRRLIAYQQAGLKEIPINLVDMNDLIDVGGGVKRRAIDIFNKQRKDGLIDGGTKIIVVQGEKAQKEARSIARESGRLCN